MKTNISTITTLLTIVISLMLMTNNAYAHCDTLDGPVVNEARVALEDENVTPLLKWVTSDEEDNIRVAFEHAIAVRKLSAEAKAMADMYFFETLVRIHRAGEGAPYTGLKPGTKVDPAVALADKAIIDGSSEKLATVLSKALKHGITSRFDRVIQTRKHADESVAAGREYVEAYVLFTHYAEGVHALVKGGTSHQEHQ